MTFDLSILLRDVVKLFPLLLIQKAEVKGMILNEYNEEDVMNGFIVVDINNETMYSCYGGG